MDYTLLHADTGILLLLTVKTNNFTSEKVRLTSGKLQKMPFLWIQSYHLRSAKIQGSTGWNCLGASNDAHCSHMEWGPKFFKIGTKWGLHFEWNGDQMGTFGNRNGDQFGPVESFWNQFLLSQVIKWLTLDSGCTDFWRVLRPKMEKMWNLKKSPQMGTNLGAVQIARTPWTTKYLQ